MVLLTVYLLIMVAISAELLHVIFEKKSICDFYTTIYTSDINEGSLLYRYNYSLF